jgi:hypothetical protein
MIAIMQYIAVFLILSDRKHIHLHTETKK